MRTTLRTPLLALSLLAAGTLLLPGVGLAAANKAADAEATIRKALSAAYPEVKIVDVRPAPIEGLYEVFTGDAIVYSNATGSLLMLGPLVDVATRNNLTTQRVDERNSIDFASLPLDLAIKTVKGDGRHTLAIFADPDCPYCKQVEQSIRTFDNVTIYTFLYPITSLHPDAANKARDLWCSANRSQAWEQWMIDGKAAEAARESCKSTPLDQLQEVAKKLRVISTPTLFFANGQRVAGAMTAEQIKKKFDVVEGSAKASADKPAAARGSSN
jgi:thiol:disulfide interchange protein DsbC